MDIKHQKDASFTQLLLCLFVNSPESIIVHSDVIKNNNFHLYDDIKNYLLVENQINRKSNLSLIIVIIML